MNILFIGSVVFSKQILEHLIDNNAKIIGVVTRNNSYVNSDHADLSQICQIYNIPCFYSNDINDNETVDWINIKQPDIIFCFGWSQLLKNDILMIPPKGVLGYHPAKLPRNRGRHPLIWALALGLTNTASTFFFMDKGADSGAIISQVDVPIDYEDTAQSLYNKIIMISKVQIITVLKQLNSNTYDIIIQNNIDSNVWRKRTKTDGQIDFRMSSRAIYNLVRAINRPYIGAHIIYKGIEIKVWSVKEIVVDYPNIEYGKVLDVRGNNLLIKCQDNAVLINDHEFENLPTVGEYIL